MKVIFAGILLLSLALSTALNAAEPVTIELAKRTWQGIPGIEHTTKGRVFACWFTGGPGEPSPDNTVVLCHSDDGGKTFTPPDAIALPLSDDTRCFDPCLWIDPKGRLWYLFNRGDKDGAIKDVHARICEAPDATPLVFGAEFRVGFDEALFAFRLNKPTALSTGEWMMPVTYAREPLHVWRSDRKLWSREATVQGVGISKDEGKTWKLHGAVSAPPFALEGIVTELKDGRLWLLNRSNPVGFLWQSYSSDKGRTWSQGAASTIPGPGARFFIRRLTSGNLLLVNHYKFKGRSHLTARLSTDDGATWNEGLLLDERGGVSYPDGVQDRDGLIWITYDRDRQGLGEILLAKFREEDVVAGNSVSGAVTLKQTINKLNKPTNLVAVTAADNARVAAMKAADREKLGASFSEELHYAHSTGAVDTKASFIALLTSGKTKYTSIDYDRRDFSFPAPGFALMTGRVHIRSTTGEAEADNLLSFLAAWRLEEGQWRFLAWQSCKLPPAAKP